MKGYGVYADGYLLKPVEYKVFEKELNEILPEIKMNVESRCCWWLYVQY